MNTPIVRWFLLGLAFAMVLAVRAAASTSATSRAIPATARPAGLSARAITAGLGHTCAITPEGAMECWGWNGFGQLGAAVAGRQRGPDAVRWPTAVVGLGGNVTAIGAGATHTCAVTSAGSIMCWGNDYSGQLGDGTSNGERSQPTTVVGLASGAIAVTGGYIHACALTAAGAVWCWGADLGDHIPGQWVAPPEQVPGLAAGARMAVAGGLHTCAALADRVVCWGDNEDGQLGTEATSLARSAQPVTVPGLGGDVTALSGGALHTCALLAGGTVKCWGTNEYGQLGDGTTVNHSVPVTVKDLGGPATAIAAGGGHTCTVLEDGRVRCWGNNWAGQLGIGWVDPLGPEMIHPHPEDVVGLDGPAVAIAGAVVAGHARFTALTGDVFVMDNGYGYQGHTCAILQNGTVRCWGANLDGQLGDGGTVSRGVPGPIFVPTDAVALPLTWR